MTVIVFAVVEGNTHHLTRGHFCNSAPRGQMITKRTLGDHNVHCCLGKRPCRTRDSEQKNCEQALQNNRSDNAL